jgi:hypothetical protein
VVLLVRNLRRLAQRTDEEVNYGLWNEDEDPPPLGTCKAAGELLEQLASAVVSGLFQKSGWRVVPPVKLGRSKRSLSDIFDAEAILDDYKLVLEYLQSHREDFKQVKGEQEHLWMKRLAVLIKRTWVDSGIGTTDPSEPVRVSLHDRPDPSNIIATEPDSLPLSQKYAETCAEASAGKRTAHLDQIAYCLVGYRWKKEPRTIRYYVELARK